MARATIRLVVVVSSFAFLIIAVTCLAALVSGRSKPIGARFSMLEELNAAGAWFFNFMAEALLVICAAVASGIVSVGDRVISYHGADLPSCRTVVRPPYGAPS